MRTGSRNGNSERGIGNEEPEKKEQESGQQDLTYKVDQLVSGSSDEKIKLIRA